MRQVVELREFSEWFAGLRDKIAQARIAARIDRLALGNPGDVKPVGAGVSELRINVGPGFRVYFVEQDYVVLVLLCGGDKSTQSRDIGAAKLLAKRLKERDK